MMLISFICLEIIDYAARHCMSNDVMILNLFQIF